MPRPNHFCGASALALALLAATPAAAARTAYFEWTPATGPVAGYAVYGSVDGGVEELYGSVSTPSVEIEVESSARLNVTVAAFDGAGTLGPRSDASTTLRLCPGDFDGDEIIGVSDYGATRGCLGQAATGACSGGDLDLDGGVGLADVALLKVGAEACPEAPPDVCGGDFDGDGDFGLSDYISLRLCVGLQATGNCAPGDIDGNGFVGQTDLQLARTAYAANTCP